MNEGTKYNQSPVDVKFLIENYDKFPVKYFAEKYNVRVSSICRLAVKLGLGRKKNLIENEQNIIDDYIRGFPLEEIANKYRIAKPTINNVIQKNNIPKRRNLTHESSHSKLKFLPKNQNIIDNIKQIYERYCNGENSNDLAKEYGVSDRHVITNAFKKFGLKPKTTGEASRKYHFNQDYFEKIDSPDKAYFLGLFYSDGCVKGNDNGLRLSIQLQERDNYILQKFLNVINSPQKMGFEKRRKEHHSDYSNITICSVKLCNDLIKLGCVQRKALILKFPTQDRVPDNLISHFIRGLFDGDGGISIFNRPNKDNIVKQYTWSLAGTASICSGVDDIFVKNLEMQNHKLYKDQNTYRLCICGDTQLRKIFNYLYQDAGDLFLTRKFDIMKQI